MPRPEALQGLTVAMIARDEEGQIGAALASVEGLAGRVVVLDTGSADGTVQAARAAGATRLSLAAVTAHQHESLEGCPSCLASVEEASSLYKGELLRDLNLPDAPGFEEWLLLRREHFHHLALRALARWAISTSSLSAASTWA